MYKILDSNGATIEEQKNIKYVKMQHNGLCCLCRKEEADGIVAADNETYYALRGRWMDGMGYEVVTVEEFVADDAILSYLNTNADSVAEMASDVAYLAVMAELADS